MLSPCRRVRLRFSPGSFVSALSAAPADASISTSDSDLNIESHSPTDAQLLRSRMRTAAAEGNLAAALAALGRLLPAPAAPDYNALLHAYLRSSQATAEHVAGVISHMRCVGPAPNALTFNTAFNGLLRLGHLDAAHAVLEEMWSGCGFVPSFTTVDRLIKKAVSGSNFDLALKEKIWAEAYRALARMCHEGCKPSVVTYTVVVNFLCKDGKTDDAMHVFRMACEKGCRLDNTICNVLLRALCCADRISEARVIIDVMEEAGLVPDYFTISALAAGFLKAGHVKTCQKFIERVCNRSNLVNIVTWNIYLHSLCCDGQVRKALALVSRMVERGFLPSTTTYNTILKGYCMELDLQRALQMLDHFRSIGVLYDSVSFNTILSAACRQGNASVIQMVLYRMNVEGINLDAVVPELAQQLGICMLSFDQPGYAESDSNLNHMEKSIALDIEELADNLQLGSKFYINGFSMGSEIMWSCLKHIPHRLTVVAILGQVGN
ncbi:hypothetical protein ABZP36_008334 [Zizania latifolia]